MQSSTQLYFDDRSPRQTKQGSNALKKIEEIRLLNKKKNDLIRKQQEEDKKQRKDEEEAKQLWMAKEDTAKDKELMTPQNFHNIMNGIKTTATEEMDIEN